MSAIPSLHFRMSNVFHLPGEGGGDVRPKYFSFLRRHQVDFSMYCTGELLNKLGPFGRVEMY